MRYRQCKRNCDRGIDCIAAALQDVDANSRGNLVGGRNDAVSRTHRLARGCAHRVGRYSKGKPRIGKRE
jgi:hypothetical protein